MFIDSHCHLNHPELIGQLPQILENMRVHSVSHALCVSVDLENFPALLALAQAHDNLFASVGVHPDDPDAKEPSIRELVELASHPKVVAIGETGLDYFRLNGRSVDEMAWQRERFRTHIRAARKIGKPLIIHTRAAAADTLAIMEEEGAQHAGGVMHCFTESWEVAQSALALDFYISISGIVTFKNARNVQDVAQRIPPDRLLIETDSPYLAPVPHRGKQNEPAFVRHVAQFIAQLRDVTESEIGRITAQNFCHLFNITEQPFSTG